MNRISKKWDAIFSGRIKDFLWMSVLALLLFSVAYAVFHTEDGAVVTSTPMSETEQKVAAILQEIDGVGEASVIVCEEEDEKSVVVVCDGANNLRVVMDVREAVAAALNMDEKSVKIYLKKNERR